MAESTLPVRRRLLPVISWSPSPDWSDDRALALAALATGALVCVLMAASSRSLPGFNDTDDAMRMVLVRALAGGRGWWDQAVMRLNPPHGVWLHWSQLLTGGEAALLLGFRAFLRPDAAEYWMRFTWPLLWIFPAIAAALALARNLGAKSAVFLAAAAMLVDLNAYRQFVPGRIDHHDIQITMTVIAMACATARRRRALWGAIGGAITGLGLAVGLEALPLQALIGASYAVQLIRTREEGRTAIAYGVSLAIVTAALFLVETPPWRWGFSFCDAIATNLVAACLVAGAGLALVGALSSRLSWKVRGALLANVGLVALAAYLALDPACINGPFAAMNPAVKPFWFDRIQEVQPLPRMLLLQRGAAIAAGILILEALAAALYLAVRRPRTFDIAVWLMFLAIIEADTTAFLAWRMQDYVYWLGLPAVAAALSWICERYLKNLMVPSLMAALGWTPASLGAIANFGVDLSLMLGHHHVPRLVNPGPKCFAASAYRQLAALPAGNVFAPQDLGPFILVFTHHSAVAAPYHRMSNVILAEHEVWNGPPAAAQSRVRALHADYLVDCPPYPIAAGPKSFGATLRKGATPAWLQPLSGPKATLKIYRVLPSAAPHLRSPLPPKG
ncbi:MAG TPA: hypothetical protein VGN38_04225 [Caulobacteraceae bacterium]|nr:hypothetical protein [Caulobacteraceae bacterium]